jgi:hypothetical protein
MGIGFYSRIQVCAWKKFAVGCESYVSVQACLR